MLEGKYYCKWDMIQFFGGVIDRGTVVLSQALPAILHNMYSDAQGSSLVYNSEETGYDVWM